MIEKFDRIIDHIQKAVKLDVRYLIKGGFWLVFSNSIQIITGAILTIALARLLDQQAYGTWQFALALVGIISIFSLTGANTAIIRSVAMGKDYALVQGTKLRVLCSLIGTIVFVGITLYLFFVRNADFWFGILLIGFLFPGLHIFENVNAFFVGKENFKKNALYSILYQTIYTVVLLIVLVLSKSINLLLSTYAVVISSLGFIFYSTAKRNIASKEVERSLARKSFEYSIATIIPTLSLYVDKLLISYFLGLNALAIYAIAIVIPETTRGILKNVIPLYFAKMVRFGEKEILKKIKQTSVYIILVFIPLIAASLYLLKIIIPLFFGETYVKSIFYSQILFASLLIVPFIFLLYNLLSAKARTKDLFKFNLFDSVIRLVLFLVLIPTYGILGAILSIVVSRLASLIYLIFLV